MAPSVVDSIRRMRQAALIANAPLDHCTIDESDVRPIAEWCVSGTVLRNSFYSREREIEEVELMIRYGDFKLFNLPVHVEGI